MEEEIFEIIRSSIRSETDLRVIREASELAAGRIRRFIMWKDDLNCPFVVHYNGVDKDRDKISYDKGGEKYNLDGVYKFWSELKPLR